MAKKKAPRKTARKTVKRPTTGAAAVTDAIRKLDAEFMKAANGRNAAGLVKAFYATDAVLMPPNHPLAERRADIQAFLQGLIDGGFSSIKLETTTVESAGDLAYGRGNYTLSMAPSGGTPFQDVGKYIVVYRRQASGAWRAIADIFNSDQSAQ
jgi:ketosteroid isomerase-like protein